MSWPGERMRHSCSSRGIMTNREQERAYTAVDALGAFVTTVVAFSGAGRPIHLNQIPPHKLSLEVHKQAREDLINAPHYIQSAVRSSAQGVVVSAQQRVDYGFDEDMQNKNVWPDGDVFYNSFNNTRQVLREVYGPTITLYRLEVPKEEQIPNKHTLNWVHSKDFLLKFKEMYEDLEYDRTIVTYEVPIEDIIAVNVGFKTDYEEFIVINRNSIGLKLPTQLEVVS